MKATEFITESVDDSDIYDYVYGEVLDNPEDPDWDDIFEKASRAFSTVDSQRIFDAIDRAMDKNDAVDPFSARGDGGTIHP